jgi:hypothetical protein
VHEPVGVTLYHTSIFDDPYDTKHVEPGLPLELTVRSDPDAGYFTTTYFTVQLPEDTGAASHVQLDVVQAD